MRATQTAATSPSAPRAGTAAATGISTSSTIVAIGRPRPVPHRSAAARRRGRGSTAPDHRTGRSPGWWEAGRDMGERRLQSEREQDDARDHRQVEVRVEVARERGPLRPRRLDQPWPARRSRPSRSTTTRAQATTVIPSRAADDLAGVERIAGRADADRDDRLAQGDDHDQPEALDEVLRRDAPSPRRARPWRPR